MGGFFLVCAGPHEDRQNEVSRLQQAFAELGFALPEIVKAEGFIFAAYPKFQNRSVGLKRYPNGDFAFVCGTCLSEGIGLASGASLYERCVATSPIGEEIMGHYAAVLRKDGRTEIKLDGFGGYHLFYNLEARIVSSSFYAICSVLPSLTLSQQSACEYVFNGVVSGNETLFGEVKLAPIQARIIVSPHALEIVRPTLSVTRTFTLAKRDASFRESIALLDRYFGAVARSFGDRVRCALSGGYDSRLILAYLRRHGMKPSVYVYGSARERDVLLAQEIARGEDFPVFSITGQRPRNLRGACLVIRLQLTVVAVRFFGTFFTCSIADTLSAKFYGVSTAALIRLRVQPLSTARVITALWREKL